jgi:CRISPR-associated protein Cas1
LESPLKPEQSNLPRIHPEYVPTEPPPPPAQFNLFTGEAEPVPIEIDPLTEEGRERVLGEGVSMVQTPDGSQVILSGFGIFLSKKSERLIVKSGKKAIYEFPLFRMSEVVVASRGISLSSDLIEELCRRGIRMSFLSGGGKPYAMVTSPMLTATVITRREQILAFTDTRGLAFSKKVVEGKIKNQEKLLRYFGKYIKEADPDRFERIEQTTVRLREIRKKVDPLHGNCIEEARETLLGLEGNAGRLYWDGVKEIISQKVEFFGRERRGATDAVNSLLNYGYGILYSQVWGAVLNAGLEPFAGFLHVDRPGKPSLVLDLVEEFRQPVVDRVVISHVNLGQEVGMKEGLLDEETRKTFGARVLERLESVEAVSGKKYQIKSIIQMQARRLCTYLRGGAEYKPFTFKW